MEAQDRINEQLESGIRNDAPFETVDRTDEQMESEDPEDGQLDLQDRRDDSFESVDQTDEQMESKDPGETQGDLQDQADGKPEADDREEDRLESENRVSEQLDLLIGEIDRAVDIVQQLRQEIAELEQRNQELHERLENQDHVISGLRAERERLRSIYDNNASLIENKEEIQRKLEIMISRLDSVTTG
jgi:FtsZ-binding cell division protein ZapB